MSEHYSTEAEIKVSRAEWGVVLSILIALAQGAFTVGVVWSSVQEHDRRIAMLEITSNDMVKRVERIDVNVSFLAERAREDRARMEGK